MAQDESKQKEVEFSKLFMSLDENGQCYALSVLRALEFAQNQKMNCEEVTGKGEKTA